MVNRSGEGFFLHTCEKAYPSLGVTIFVKNQDWPLEVAGAKLGGGDRNVIYFFTQDDPYTILTIFLLGRPCLPLVFVKFRVKPPYT